MYHRCRQENSMEIVEEFSKRSLMRPMMHENPDLYVFRSLSVSQSQSISESASFFNMLFFDCDCEADSDADSDIERS